MSGGDHSENLQRVIDRAADDESHYAELISVASARLLKLTRAMFRHETSLRRWEQTDDVFQVVSLRLYNSLSHLRPKSVAEFFGLATLQIRRSLIDLARHHFGPEGSATMRQSLGGKGLPLEQRDHSRSSEPEDLEAWSDFHECAAAIPIEYREVFSLRYYSGLSHEEIANVTNQSLATVKRKWRRAKIWLAEQLSSR